MIEYKKALFENAQTCTVRGMGPGQKQAVDAVIRQVLDDEECAAALERHGYGPITRARLVGELKNVQSSFHEALKQVRELQEQVRLLRLR